MSFLQIEQVHKTYFQKKKPVKKAVRGVSFEVHKGEIFGLLGVNGAGKTTLSGILAGLHPPTSGSVLSHGKSIYEDILSYRSRVGLCPQKPNIDPDLTLTEALVFSGRCFGKSQKEAICKKDHLFDLLNLDEYANSIARHLSGGYRQRFLLARTLVHSPEFVILDEPTVGLDAQIRKSLWNILKRLRDEGVTILLTTHYLEEAESISDRVCFIHQGQVKAIDTPSKLNESYGKANLEDVFLHLTEESEETKP